MKNTHLKEQVKNYWNQASCGTEFINKKKFSSDYFNSIEEFRYAIEPEIFAFAQFTRWYRKKVLEVGIGAGTDFTQWVKAGALAHGIDLTKEALANTTKRLELLGLEPAKLIQADAENLPFEDNSFDLTYSWGVIHHSPDTPRCFEEIVRVTKPGGTIKIMIYNRRSLFAVYRWLCSALFKGKVFRSIKYVLFHDQESRGTKAYTFKEAKKMITNLPVELMNIKATVSNHDLLYYKSKPFQWLAYITASLWGWNRCGWFMTMEFKKNK